MRINHNIAALNTYRQLNTASTAQSKSMEKLASGLRINKAGDDAAGLAISEKMRGQIRGLEMGSKNAQDGISLIQTAEGALNETHDILQRMRELAVQSSNDTNTNDDRTEIQKEVTQLAEEITRIAKNTEFNTQGLLDGSFTGKFHIGSNAGQSLEISIDAMDASTLLVGTGGTTTYTGGTPSAVTGTASNVSISATGTYAGADATGVTVNTANLTVTPSTVYGSTDSNVSSATGFTGNVSNIELTWTDSYEVTSAPSTGTISNISGFTGSLADMTISYTEAGGAAGIDDAADISIDVNGGGAGAWSATAFNGTKVTISDGTQSFDIDMAGITSGNDTGAFSIGKSGDISIGEIGIDVNSGGAGAWAATAVNGSVVTISDGTQSFDYDMSGEADGVATSQFSITGTAGNTYGGTIDIGGTTFSVAGNGAATATTGTYAGLTVDVTGAAANQTGTFDISGRTAGATAPVAGIDVSSQAAADSAITVINDAIKTVSGQRSALGAYQNRLEHTINNLNTSSENLTAAESRVRDVDMAKEMMAQTKNSILSQAAQAMLAQANQQPQGVLQLLR
ncbi:flagellin [Cytobacillus sp. FJAT-53684]|uniref:Flagellin n=1 Tax=Cytobacillus mangrovibacter TaxID=3299024 RepID=A0ABW6JZJ0_9BACI